MKSLYVNDDDDDDDDDDADIGLLIIRTFCFWGQSLLVGGCFMGVYVWVMRDTETSWGGGEMS